MSTVYSAIVTAYEARAYCDKSGNDDWFFNWDSKLKTIEREILPNGGGFDCYPEIISANDDKIIIHGSFHCMDEMGGYDGWLEFAVIVRPSLQFGAYCKVKARGMKWPRRYADMREYIQEVYNDALHSTTED